jgi:hypothetical protein
MSRYNYTKLNPRYRLPILPKFVRYLVATRRSFDGWQAKYKFKNGYGASIIQHRGAFGSEEGLWELGILHNDVLCYDTPIAQDVIGYQDEQGLSDLLAEIASLPEKIISKGDSDVQYN